jgi:hypothetical protein
MNCYNIHIVIINVQKKKPKDLNICLAKHLNGGHPPEVMTGGMPIGGEWLGT